MVNDVSGGLADPDMARVVADAGRAVDPHALARALDRTWTRWPRYDDVVADVRDELSARVDAALAAGVDPDALVLDPGLGFAKRGRTQLGAAAPAGCVAGAGFPVLVGASRKRFLGTLLADKDGMPRPPDGREDATAAISALVAMAGAWGVRVHDVPRSLDAVRSRMHAADD